MRKSVFPHFFALLDKNKKIWYNIIKKIKGEAMYNYEQIKNLSDYEKRVALIQSWQGQINYCQKKKAKDPYFEFLAQEWQKKIDLCLAGAPLSECQGEVKVKGKKPMTKKQRIAYKKEQKAKIGVED